MSTEELYETAFQLILCAGNAKSNAMRAIEAAREFRFEEAEELIEEAKKDFTEAHHIQTGMLQGEAQGQKNEVSLIMVHAQDHLTMAMMTVDNAKEMIHLYGMIAELKKEKNNE